MDKEPKKILTPHEQAELFRRAAAGENKKAASVSPEFAHLQGAPFYDFHNKLHWMVDGVSASTKKAREAFMQDLSYRRKMYKEAAEATGQENPLDDKTYNHICDLLNQCTSFYEVEALARFVIDGQMVPNLFSQVQERALALCQAAPFYAAHEQKKKGFI